MILRKIKRQKGATLTQLLIGTLLTFIVSSTAIDLVWTSSNSSEQQKLEADLNKEGLFASILIANDLTRAGDLDYGTSPFTRTPFDWSKTGQKDSENDELAILFYNHNNTTSCSGDSTIGVLTNHYEITNDALYCNDVLLMENVERFNIYFGADLDGDGTIDRYVDSNSANLITTDPQQRVLSVRFNLLIKGEKSFGSAYLKTFSLVNGQTLTYNDRITYKYFEREIILRNML